MTTAVLRLMFLLLAFWAWGCGETASAQFFKPMRQAADLIHRQDPLKVYPERESALTADNMHVEISISKQRAYLMAGDLVYADSPISSGKVAGMTPTGSFSVLDKDLNHKSTIYGEFVDSGGRTVRSGVSLKIDSAPSGTHYLGANMKYFMRLTDGGVGMHVGILPGYPASHGCVRLPEETARLFYSKVHIGTPVTIAE